MRLRTKHLCVKVHHFREHVRKGLVSINKIPTQYQLGDIATKAQPEALFISQRESILQWDAEYMSREELNLPTKHLRACDISDNAKDLCMSQHANAFSETLSQTVAEGIGIDTMTGIVTESFKGPGTKTEIGTRPGIKHMANAGRTSSHVKSIKPKDLQDPKQMVLTGKALTAWIIDKGFNGKTTKLQRDCPKGGKSPMIKKK